VAIPQSPGFFRVLQVIEFACKGCSHKDFSRQGERLERVYEISEKKVGQEPFTSSNG
jgi:hypothetical protein